MSAASVDSLYKQLCNVVHERTVSLSYLLTNRRARSKTSDILSHNHRVDTYTYLRRLHSHLTRVRRVITANQCITSGFISPPVNHSDISHASVDRCHYQPFHNSSLNQCLSLSTLKAAPVQQILPTRHRSPYQLQWLHELFFRLSHASPFAF